MALDFAVQNSRSQTTPSSSSSTMAPKQTKAEKKIAYDGKLCQLLEEYGQILVVNADNVGSNQLQNIRKGLRGDSVVLMGKNTMMKRSVRIHAEKTGNNVYLSLIPLLVVSFPFSLIFLSFYCLFCSTNCNEYWGFNCLVDRTCFCVIIGQCGIDFHQGRLEGSQ